MLAVTFADAETRAAASAMGRLANASANFLGGAPVAVIFDAAYAAATPGLGLASSAPALTLPTASVPVSPVGKAVTVGGVNFTIAEHHPDGTGLSVLVLEKA